MSKQVKKKFFVEENETIDQCLERMKLEGYSPFRRMEEPIFQEVEIDGVKDVEPCGRRIVFEGKLAKSEH
ncbi:NETI motif-containing protein [Bacillus salitolerans]|uniref:NETI motif-containing protein n=1 Tax=Bacillus salitolerans TaxID=1437434 RepID=A0ABW4LSA1_9BACI